MLVLICTRFVLIGFHLVYLRLVLTFRREALQPGQLRALRRKAAASSSSLLSLLVLEGP